MARKRRKATQISPELDLRTQAETHYKKTYQDNFGIESCIGCGAEKRDVPISQGAAERMLCTVCCAIMHLEGAMDSLERNKDDKW